MGFLAIFTAVGLPFGMLTLVLAHVTFCVPYIYIVVKGRLAGMDPRPSQCRPRPGRFPGARLFDGDAAADPPRRALRDAAGLCHEHGRFCHQLFRHRPGHDYAAGEIYSSVRMGVSLQVNALSTLMLATVFLLTAAFRLLRRKRAAQTA